MGRRHLVDRLDQRTAPASDWSAQWTTGHRPPSVGRSVGPGAPAAVRWSTGWTSAPPQLLTGPLSGPPGTSRRPLVDRVDQEPRQQPPHKRHSVTKAGFGKNP